MALRKQGVSPKLKPCGHYSASPVERLSGIKNILVSTDHGETLPHSSLLVLSLTVRVASGDVLARTLSHRRTYSRNDAEITHRAAEVA